MKIGILCGIQKMSFVINILLIFFSARDTVWVHGEAHTDVFKIKTEQYSEIWLESILLK